MTDAMNVEKLTRTYIKIRDAKAELAKRFRDEEAALNEQLDIVKHALLDYCADQGVDSVRTPAGMFYRTTKSRYWTSDWGAMHSFIIENAVPEFLDKRLNQKAVAQFLEENPEAVLPGLNQDMEYVVTVRKPK